MILTLPASYGVAAGGEALASSVTSAMEGVFVSIFTTPLQGIMQIYLCRR